MTTREVALARVGTVVGFVIGTVWVLAALAATGAVTFVAAVLKVGGSDGDAYVFAAVTGGLASVVAVILARFAHDLAPVRALPDITGAELKAAAGTVGTSLLDGERRFVDARGFGRAVRLGQALWDLRGDLKTLGDGGLAPAAALVETMIPTRLIRVGICALIAPFLLGTGLLALAFALVLS